MTDRERLMEEAAMLILPCEEYLLDNTGPCGLDDTTLRIADALLEAEARGNEWWPAEHRVESLTLNRTICMGRPYHAKMNRAAELRAKKAAR